MGEIGMLGETAETRALELGDRGGDEVFGMSRQGMTEGELVRDYPVEAAGGRLGLMRAAEDACSVMDGWGMVPLDDRLVVEYASFREGYVCEECGGAGHGGVICAGCDGVKRRRPKPGWDYEECVECRAVGSEGIAPASTGFAVCGVCRGSGLKVGVVALPDAAKQDHSYGDVRTVGAGVYDLRVGDRVAFSKMAGIYIKGEEKRNFCLLRRGEVMGLMVRREARKG